MTALVFGRTCSYEYGPGSFIKRGCNGIVYKAAITEHGNFAGSREVAVKVLFNPDWEHPDYREQTNASKMKKILELEHPHLVKYHKITVFRERRDWSIELLMDYFPDGNLDELLRRIKRKRRPLHPVKAISYAVDIAEGLKYLHEREIMLCNLQPKNILVDSGERLLICNYEDCVRGDVMPARDLTHLMESLRYMSPEMIARKMISRKGPVGKKTDIWSLGCILLQLAKLTVSTKTHWSIEKGGHVMEIFKPKVIALIRSMVDGYVPIVDESIAPEVAAWVRQCLRIDSNERISASQLLDLIRHSQDSSLSVTTGFPETMTNAKLSEREPELVINEESFGSNCECSYSMRDCIGYGAIGQVYKATITVPGNFSGKNTVAVKVVHLDNKNRYLQSNRNWPKLRNRLVTIVNIRNKSLLDYHKFSVLKTTSGIPYIELMMDYCEGDLEKLLNRLRTGIVPPEESLQFTTAIRYALDITNGINFLHQNKIIHGDLKPKNILVKETSSRHKRLLIGDLDEHWQMTGTVTRLNDVPHFHGTIRYLPPEMFKRFRTTSQEIVEERNINTERKMDIWSLGCIMLDLADCIAKNDEKWLEKKECEQSEKIMAGKSIADHVFEEKLVNGFVPFVPDSIPNYYSSCIRQCLRSASEERPSAEQLLTLLEEADKKVPKELFVFFHGHQENQFSSVLMQSFEPLTGTLRPLMFGNSLKNMQFRHGIFTLGNDIVCRAQDKTNSDKHTIELDIAQKSWRTTTADTAGLGIPAKFAVNVDDHIYFWDEEDVQAPFKKLDGRNFSVSPLPMPHWIRRVDRIVRSKNKIFVIGASSSESVRLVERFDTTTKQWGPPGSVASLPDDRVGFAAVVFNKELYLLGGQTTSETAPQLLKSCVRLDRKTSQWVQVSDLLHARTNHCAFVYQEQVYVFGGRIDGTDGLAQTMQVCDAKTWQWSTFPLPDLDDVDMDPSLNVSYVVRVDINGSQCH
ncbi:dual specificity protein kinase zak2-like [Paramacrobiotus metropolitanus]|uniref:dual specificity protein kinase zak2-like n=1 Tax=Paramacrobiotus metropolitanus TaxID=2943436 RepID=UPI00244621E1|nr:dual specificity protein kinase zak2-like [Paramacrobiotus metropolitanus]